MRQSVTVELHLCRALNVAGDRSFAGGLCLDAQLANIFLRESDGSFLFAFFVLVRTWRWAVARVVIFAIRLGRDMRHRASPNSFKKC